MNSFEREYARLMDRHLCEASGQRLEMLKRDLDGTRKMLEVAVWPVMRSLDGISLELELVSSSGFRIYVDAFVASAGLALESEGFATHAETITRDRFSLDKSRVRTIASYGYYYIPFSRDQLDKRPEECRSSFAELLGKHDTAGVHTFSQLNVYEREALRYAKSLHRDFRPADVEFCLDCSRDFSRKVLQSLVEKTWIVPSGSGSQRIRQYTLEDKAYRLRL